MSVYLYKAKSPEGQPMNGLVEAPTEQNAATLLREKGLYIVSLTLQEKKISLDNITKQFTKIGFNETVNFTRQMATLAVAGLSIPESMGIIRAQSENPAYVELLLDIEHHVVGGGTLASALAKHPEIFSKVYIALVKAGEASGKLDLILTRLAENLENEKEFRSKVKSVMIYPVIIIIGMGAVIFIMMTVVLPKLTEMYKEFDIDLPWSTRFIIGLSDFFVSYWWLMIVGLIGGFFVFRRWKKTDVGELVVDKLMLRVPLFGNIQTKILLAEFTRTLSMLIIAGIHILDGLKLIEDTMGNVLFRDALKQIAQKVEKGYPMGESFAQFPIFPAIVAQMIRVGEETGKLDDSLTKLSSYFEREAEYLVKNLTTAIEPLIMIILGLGVGFIVFSIITPIYSLTSQIK